MWVLYAVLNPIADASRNVFSKKASMRVNFLLVSWVNNFVPMVLFLPVLFLVELRFNYHFFEAVFISGIVNVAAAILYHRAIQIGDISAVVPMLSFTPLFLLIFSPLLVNEFPDATGLAGIILIVTGSYLLNINMKVRGIFSPLRSIIKDRGTRYMLIVAAIWSISANFDKRGIEASSVWQYIFFINLFVTTIITIFIGTKGLIKTEAMKPEWKNLLLVGLITGFGFFVHMTALSLTLVAYVVSLKRTAGMISVGLGYFFLNEKNIRERFLGSFIMFIGVLLIVLF
jgi:uncharacterized membrane protein